MQTNKMACGAVRAGRESRAMTGHCSHSAQPRGVSPPTLGGSWALRIHQLPASKKGRPHPEPYHCSIVEVNQHPGLLPFPRSGSPARRSAARKKPGCCQNKDRLIVLGREVGWRWMMWSPSLCGSGHRSRDAVLCLGALTCRWVPRGDAQQENLIFSFVCFLLFLARLMWAGPAIWFTFDLFLAQPVCFSKCFAARADHY